MINNTRWFIFLLMVVVACIIAFFAGMAVQQNRVQGTTGSSGQKSPAEIANRLLDQLQTAYNTQNIPSIVNLYNNPTVGVDVTRNDNRFYTASGLFGELEKAIKEAGLTDIKCSFTNREITAEGDMIMVRTVRAVTANEIPKAVNCLMLLILRKQFIYGKFRGYVITDQILLKEEYVQKPAGGN